MPIDVKCPGCSRRFRVPDKYAGKRIKCPQCQGRIEISGAAEPKAAESTEPKAAESTEPKAAESTPKAEAPRKQAPQKPAAAKPEPVEEWHVQADEGEQFGPVSKEELDEWVADGRLDASCQLLREGWPQWKWAEEVYPELGESAAEVPEVSEQPQIQPVPPPVPSEPAENPFAGIGEAAPEITPSPIVSRKTRHRPYRALRTLAMICTVLAWVIGILGLLQAVWILSLFFTHVPTVDTLAVSGLLLVEGSLLLGTFLWVVILMAFAQGIKLNIDIEHNTHESADASRKMLEVLADRKSQAADLPRAQAARE